MLTIFNGKLGYEDIHMVGPIFEAEITPILKPRDVMKLAELAEEVGIDRLGISDVIFYPDTFEIQALCALVTKRIKIGSLVTNQSLYKTSCCDCKRCSNAR